jgi:hypothetical protein
MIRLIAVVAIVMTFVAASWISPASKASAHGLSDSPGPWLALQHWNQVRSLVW